MISIIAEKVRVDDGHGVSIVDIDGDGLDGFGAEAVSPGGHHAAAAVLDLAGNRGPVGSIEPVTICKVRRADGLDPFTRRTVTADTVLGEDRRGP